MAPSDLIPVHAALDARLRTTSVCVSVGYGARHDPPGGGGLAHMLEHIVMSVPDADGTSFSERVERLGGHANAETGLEAMLFYGQVHADDADEVAAALVDAVTAPRFTAAGLESERAAVLQELAAAHADPSDVVQDLFLARLFPGHPLGRPVAGTVDEVNALDLDTIQRGHAEVFRIRPMAVVVVGPRLPASLAGAPQVPGPAPRPAPDPPPPVDTTPANWPDEFTWLCVGGRSPRLGVPNWEYEVLAQLLGGSPSSLLYRRLRVEKGLAYMFQAWNRAYTEAGAWRVFVGAEPANCPAVLDVVRESLELVAAGEFRDSDLTAARRQARMRLILDMESPLEYARLLGQRWSAGHDLAPQSALDALDRVTGDAVSRVARTLLTELVIAVAPAKS